MVRHTHPATHQCCGAKIQIQICCDCRDKAGHPFTEWIKKNVPDVMFTSSPCLLDEFADLSDETLLGVVNHARRKPEIGEDIYRSYAVLKWGAIEIENRGLTHLFLEAREQDI